MCRVSASGASLHLALLEQLFPAAEQRLELVAGAPVRLQRLDVGPVVRELALEVGERLLARGDLALERRSSSVGRFGAV